MALSGDLLCTFVPKTVILIELKSTPPTHRYNIPVHPLSPTATNINTSLMKPTHQLE